MIDSNSVPMPPPVDDPVLLDFAGAFATRDETTKEHAVVTLETLVRDPFQLRRRIAFLEGVAESVSSTVLLPLFRGAGLLAHYYKKGRSLESTEIELLDHLSRNPAALRAVHEGLRPAVTTRFRVVDGPIGGGGLPVAAKLAAAALVLVAFGFGLKAVTDANRAREAEIALAQTKAEAERVVAQAESKVAERDRTIASLQGRERESSLAEQTELHAQPAMSSDGKFPYIDLFFGDVSPATISKIDLVKYYTGEKNNDEFLTLYYWRSRPLPPSVRVEYRHEANDPPRPIRTLVRYYLTTTGKTVDRFLDLTSTPEGVAFRRLPQEVDLLAKAATTKDGEVDLSLGIGGVPPRDDVAQATKLMVVIRPVGGEGPWGGGKDAKYDITDTGLTLADLGAAGRLSVKVDLKRLGVPERPEESPPSDYELLFVALPAAPKRSQIGAAEFNNTYGNRVVKTMAVHWDRTPPPTDVL